MEAAQAFKWQCYTTYGTILLSKYRMHYCAQATKQLPLNFIMVRTQSVVIQLLQFYPVVSSKLMLACPGRQRNLILDCHSNDTVLTWSITIPRLNGVELLQSISSTTVDEILTLNYAEFQFEFVRNSISPLQSTLFISNWTSRLNGTTINCTQEGITSITIILVVGNGKCND